MLKNHYTVSLSQCVVASLIHLYREKKKKRQGWLPQLRRKEKTSYTLCKGKKCVCVGTELNVFLIPMSKRWPMFFFSIWFVSPLSPGAVRASCVLRHPLPPDLIVNATADGEGYCIE